MNYRITICHPPLKRAKLAEQNKIDSTLYRSIYVSDLQAEVMKIVEANGFDGQIPQLSVFTPWDVFHSNGLHVWNMFHVPTFTMTYLLGIHVAIDIAVPWRLHMRSRKTS